MRSVEPSSTLSAFRYRVSLDERKQVEERAPEGGGFLVENVDVDVVFSVFFCIGN